MFFMKWIQDVAISAEDAGNYAQHVLIVLDETSPESCIFSEYIHKTLRRRQQQWSDLSSRPLTAESSHGGLLSIIRLSSDLSVFSAQALLRKALQPLLEEFPERLAICLQGDASRRTLHASWAAYVATVNAQPLPQLKKTASFKALHQIVLLGAEPIQPALLQQIEAQVAGNQLCRQLTMTPPNQLTPTLYRQQLQTLSQQQGWQYHAWDVSALQAMGAGAFVAVAQGSLPQDAAIVRLSYRHPQATKTVALVGKGICFDTGGHNLKSAKYMQGMHQDMNGSAVAVGALLAVTQCQLPVNVDCWLALAQNHIGPQAYKQNDVVKALNGMTIEVVHTDAEGRMVLADTLTLANQDHPDVLIDFATLTGSMQTALGSRMSGIIANDPLLASQWVEAGNASGERLVAFPYADDYDVELDSEIADIKQCTLESDADHILAARFLGNFIPREQAWCHIDLSSYAHKGGLGAVASEVNGFGVALTLQWLKYWYLRQ